MPATIHPDPLPAWVRDNPLRKSEIAVYDALRRQLPSRYRVYYSSPWLGTESDGTEKDGEADFVVASAETGFLVIEVKGGGVGRDKRTGDWHSMDRWGFKHSIKNPVAQATKSKHQLLQRMKALSSIGNRWISTGIAVILPDSSGGNALDGLDTPREKFALREDMERLGDWVRAHLDHNMGDHSEPLGAEGIAALDRMIAHAFQLHLPLAVTLETDSRRVLTATKEQCELLQVLEEHRRVAIAGVAGSGKTIIAVHKSMQLAEADPGARVLLTCFNVPLGEHLKRLTARQPNIIAGSFHQVCARIAREAGLPTPLSESVDELMAEALSEALVTAVGSRPELAFDAVIVDEGQDFSDNWMESLNQCCTSDCACFWVFYDDNQRLYGRSSKFLSTFPGPPFKLRRNVRNPKPVFDRLVPLFGAIAATSAGPEGRPVEEIVVQEERLMPSALKNLVTRLVETEQVEPEEIVVLATTKERLDELCPSSRLGRVAVCDAVEATLGRVCMETVRRFKGLERSVVILLDPVKMMTMDELQYVGLSRPTGHLILLGTRMPKFETTDDD